MSLAGQVTELFTLRDREHKAREPNGKTLAMVALALNVAFVRSHSYLLASGECRVRFVDGSELVYWPMWA